MNSPIPEAQPAPGPSTTALATMPAQARGYGAARPGLLSRIMRRWWLIGLMIGAGLVSGLIYFSSAAKTYAASSVIGTAHIAGTSKGDPYFAAQRAMILSARLLQSCGADLRQVQVSTSDAEGTITIRCEASSGALAARTANAIAMAYVQRQDQAISPAAAQLKDLAHQRAQAQAARDAAANALNDQRAYEHSFEAADRAALTRLAQLRATQAAAQAALDDIAAEINAAPAAIANSQKLHELITSHRGTGIFDALDVQHDRVTNQIDALAPILDQQRRSMLPQHPSRQASEAKMRQLQAQLASLDGQYGPLYEHWLDEQRRSADEKVRAMAQMVAQQETAAKDAANRAQKDAAMSAALKTAEAQLAEMDQKWRDLSLSSAAAPPTVKIILPAEIPQDPVRPDRQFVLMIGAAAGLVLSLLLAAAVPASTRRRV